MKRGLSSTSSTAATVFIKVSVSTLPFSTFKTTFGSLSEIVTTSVTPAIFKSAACTLEVQELQTIPVTFKLISSVGTVITVSCSVSSFCWLAHPKMITNISTLKRIGFRIRNSSSLYNKLYFFSLDNVSRIYEYLKG